MLKMPASPNFFSSRSWIASQLFCSAETLMRFISLATQDLSRELVVLFGSGDFAAPHVIAKRLCIDALFWGKGVYSPPVFRVCV